MQHNNLLLKIVITIIMSNYYFYSLSKQPQTSDSKILVVSLMVKNEESAMVLTLQPLIDAGITQYFIYDTGSTDNTIAVTRDIFEKNKIQHFIIKQGPWIDFAASRNKALELTEQCFPYATFILMLDAEWILHNGADLLKFCQTQKDTDNIVYSIVTTTSQLAKYEDRLFRTKSNVHFIGKVHEWPNISGQMIVPKPVFIEFTRSVKSTKKSEQRWTKDRDVLLQEITNNPKNLRAMAMLAQTYLSLQDYTKAIICYKKLTTFSYQNNEDTFANYYYLAISYEQNGDLDNAILTYLKAFEIRPCRADPLIKLAALYFHKKDFALAFLFAKQAITIPLPTHEHGIIEKSLYDITRFEIVSLTAHLFHEHELGKQATIKILQNNPQSLIFKKQLQFYETTTLS